MKECLELRQGDAVVLTASDTTVRGLVVTVSRRGISLMVKLTDRALWTARGMYTDNIPLLCTDEGYVDLHGEPISVARQE